MKDNKLVFVITGKLELYTRKQITSIIQQAGGIVNNLVTSNTDYLIIGQRPGYAKLNGARYYNVKVLKEEEFEQESEELIKKYINSLKVLSEISGGVYGGTSFDKVNLSNKKLR